MFLVDEEKTLKIFHTHSEISPYKKGENERFEKRLSVWIDPEYRYDPIGYMIHNDTLYIPRGISQYILENEFHTKGVVITTPDEYDYVKNVRMTGKPRDTIQTDAIDFMCGLNKYKRTQPFSQQALVLDTGYGKTFVTVYSIVFLGMKAIIITHQEKIKTQWIDTFYNFTNSTTNDIVNINGSSHIKELVNDSKKGKKLFGSYYFINHQTLHSYGREYGYDAIREFFKAIRVGIKVYDEAHLEFANILRVDFFSNTKKTFYLTANFDRSDKSEKVLFKKCFASTTMFDSAVDSEEAKLKRKHIIYIPVVYRSNPNYVDLARANNAYGFSVLRFMEYATHIDPQNTMYNVFFYILDKALSSLEGKILITIARIEDTKEIKEEIEKRYPSLNKVICTINSNNKKEENEYAKENADIIISTIKSTGTGVDIKGLRCIINMEPFSSTIRANQLSGRLREYAPDLDTYFFDLIDVAFPACKRQYQVKTKFLEKKCKAIHPVNWQQIKK